MVKRLLIVGVAFVFAIAFSVQAETRQRELFTDGWRFFKYKEISQADSLIYDIRPSHSNFDDSINADAKPTDAVMLNAKSGILKPWIMPTGNAFLVDKSKHYQRPEGTPGDDFPFVQSDFDDTQWEAVDLPHDWAIKGPFYAGDNPEVGGGMGRLPSPGVAWYRKSFSLSPQDGGKQIYLDIDGAMSYSMVWLNGHLVGGWPYGYSSYRLDLTPYINKQGKNQLAIRLDNPPSSSRWYPGGGIYRNVWLVKTAPVHVSQWGTQITTSDISDASAKLKLTVSIDNTAAHASTVTVQNKVYELSIDGQYSPTEVSAFPEKRVRVAGNTSTPITLTAELKDPKLWGPVPQQTPHRYAVITKIIENGKTIDEYTTPFGVRTLTFDPNVGVLVNHQPIALQGVNQHHDLGALGSAFNLRAAERQLEMLQEMGVNAIRMAHNPPAPELLELTDKMGILVLNESFDSWYKKKTPLDFHLIFKDWHEQDLRALVRRDRNHPSVIMWYIGNEVGEQYTGEEGAEVAYALKNIVKQEDPTRPVTASKNWAKADFPFSHALDLISLNYQGEGIRQRPEFEGTERIRTPPSYPLFHQQHPGKVILSSETASAFSSRGVYYFPVTEDESAPVRDGLGGNSKTKQVSSYELHAVDFGSSADKVFRYLDNHPYVAGQFVWNGWDYIGEPTPYYSSRSSYSGIIDLAGFKKDRFYLYQSQWRPQLPMVHILPHWNWPDRVGQVTPVHVFSSGDEVELFLNGQSQGRQRLQPNTYRFRFDNVIYEAGVLRAVAYKKGKFWAESVVHTTDKASSIKLTSDRSVILGDGLDLVFVTADIVDGDGRTIPDASHKVTFTVSDNAQIVATDNGDSTNFTPFPSASRNAFSGKVLAIIRVKPSERVEPGAAEKGEAPGIITISAQAEGLTSSTTTVAIKRVESKAY